MENIETENNVGVMITPSIARAAKGENASFQAVLNTQPTDNVIVRIGSQSLTFTPINWSFPQTVTVAALENKVIADNVLETITLSSMSEDMNYHGNRAKFIDSAGNVINSVLLVVIDQNFGTSPSQYYTLSGIGSDTQIHHNSRLRPIDNKDEQTIVKLPSKAIYTNTCTAIETVQDDKTTNCFDDAECNVQQVTVCDKKNCTVRVYGKQGLNSSKQSYSAPTFSPNPLKFLNFSGHSLLSGGAEDVVLGFILEGQGSADMVLDTNIIDQGALPKMNLNEMIYDETMGFYSHLHTQSQNNIENFSFDKTLDAGAYTIQLSSNGVKGHGMAGITLKNNSLHVTNLSVRGYLEQALVFNFMVDGDGTQKAKITTQILQGKVESQINLINLTANKSISGESGIENGATIDISAGTYAVMLNVLSGQGIGMICVHLM
ncbi:hypothetical protein [Candidatus Albibeggiatoa sp. nov. NOAA]|uniref:hypothetical protein n=1 Tax=Candidatus Albibeggiatoa sp. nov. NOAA TaxID=3162724 RepID=UPI0032F817E7|nr:hypothetical protein [Thiotrichaceae bacterium]